MSEAVHDWDGWLSRLVEDDTARRVGDIRAYLIAEISRAIACGDALLAADPDVLAEIAVDVMIECTRKSHFRPN